MKIRLFLPILILSLLLACAPQPSAPIILDGQFDDWEGRPPAFVDGVGDASPGSVDFAALHLAHTATHLLLKIQVGREINLQSTPGLLLTLDTDGDPATGPELVYDLGARQGVFTWEGRAIPIQQADLGLIPLPTISSNEFEIALARDAFPGGAAPLFAGEAVSVRLEDASGGDQLPAPGGSVPYSFTGPPLPLPEPLPIQPPSPGNLRLLTWNMLRDGLFDPARAPAFRRILTLLQPEVIAFQEVYNRSDVSVKNKLEEWLGGVWYTVKVGDLVTASRFPFVEDWTSTYQPLEVTRTFPVMLTVNGARLILFNAHLSCCDADAERQEQVDRVIAFLRDASLPPNTPLIFAGDLNLVGDAQQLKTLLAGDIADETRFGADHSPDGDATPLALLLPRHTHAPFAYTWRDDSSSFAPGRLDYILYTDSALTPVQSFILQTETISPDALAQYNLSAEDALLASDHLPLVADFKLPGR